MPTRFDLLTAGSRGHASQFEVTDPYNRYVPTSTIRPPLLT
jgi:hypothetical protein